MIMGSCMAQYDISMVHLNNFHQAKWEEYSEGYLDNNTPFSFHKHYDNDPIQVYGNWFGLDDQRWWSTKAHDHPDNVQRDQSAARKSYQAILSAFFQFNQFHSLH